MDTRNKIIEPPRAEEIVRGRLSSGAPLKLTTGYFDPLTAAHARRLAEIAGEDKLVVCITSPEDPVLEAKARAVLVAALEVAEYVTVCAPEQAARLLEITPAEAVTREESADAERTEKLIRHVQQRHTA